MLSLFNEAVRGILLAIFSVLSILGFSIVLFFSDNLMMFWLFLELTTLSLVPSFFLYFDGGVLGGLFNYIVVSGVSSSLIVSGVLFDGFLFLSVLGLILKFGLFPFFGWVYVVVVSSNWLVIWGLSTVLKSAFLIFCFFLSGGYDLGIINICCILTFGVIGILFWVYTFNWSYYWCHVMVSSSAMLVVMAVGISSDVLLYLFVIYTIWATLVIILLSQVGEDMKILGGGLYFFVVLLLVSFPGSIAIFYKLFAGLCVYSCGLAVFLSWVLYSISEQFYLIKFLISLGLPRTEWNGGVLV